MVFCSLSSFAGRGSSIRADSTGAIVDGGPSCTPATSVVSVVGFSSTTGVALIETVCSSTVEVALGMTLADAEGGLEAGGSSAAVELSISFVTVSSSSTFASTDGGTSYISTVLIISSVSFSSTVGGALTVTEGGLAVGGSGVIDALALFSALAGEGGVTATIGGSANGPGRDGDTVVCFETFGAALVAWGSRPLSPVDAFALFSRTGVGTTFGCDASFFVVSWESTISGFGASGGTGARSGNALSVGVLSGMG